MVGNVLFAAGLPPAIIDLSLYWRPPGYSAALVVGDAIVWEDPEGSLIELLRPFQAWPQLLLRAVIFRIVASELAKRAEPWRQEITHEYDGIVDRALSAAGYARFEDSRGGARCRRVSGVDCATLASWEPSERCRRRHRCR